MGTENTESLDGVVLQPMLCWTESGEPRSAHWRSEANVSPPKRVQIVDDTLTADTAYRLAGEGTQCLARRLSECTPVVASHGAANRQARRETAQSADPV